MKRHTAREWTVEEFDDWSAASDRVEAVAAGGGRGGRAEPLAGARDRAERGLADRLVTSRVGEPDAEAPATTPPRHPLRRRRARGQPQAPRRLERRAAAAVPLPISPRPARSISPAPPRASPRARPIGCGPARRPSPRPGTRRTSSPSGGSPPSPSIARSTAASSRSGRSGNLVAEKRVPSDRLLMWLLARLDPRRFAAPWELRKDGAADPQAEAREAFPALLDALTDIVSQ